MTNGIEYKTKQRADLVAFLETVKGEHLTAKTICELLDKSGVRMGSATVYRHLERLVGEGLMLKYSMGSNGAACFEYVGPEGQCCTPHCFHCVCTSCGRLIHVECAHLAEISGHMLESHGFAIDPMRTVFYGVCEDCASQE